MYAGRLTFPVIASAGMLNGKRFIGMGGLAWIEGRCWLWVDHVDMKRTAPLQIVRAGKAMLQKAYQLGEVEVWARREVGLEPHSAKLLTILGFERVDGNEDVEDWRRSWPNLPQSPSVSPPSLP